MLRRTKNKNIKLKQKKNNIFKLFSWKRRNRTNTKGRKKK